MGTSACRACGEQAVREVVWAAENFRESLRVAGEYKRCDVCRSLNLVPVPSDDELRAAYDGLLAPHDVTPERVGLRAWVRNLRPNPHELPLRPPRRGARVLDVGCGTAAKLRVYQRAGWECFGTDLSAAAIETSRRETTGMHLHAGPTHAAPFERASFDLVRSDNVVEHLPDPIGDLRAMASFARPGGRIRVYVPSATGLTVRLCHEGSISSWVPFHLTLFSIAGLRRLFERAGMPEIRIDHYTPISWLHGSVQQTLALRGWSPAAAGSVSRLLGPAYRPIGWLANRLRMGDELIATASV